ncbi:MAG: glutamyl-tRNA reductase [Stackebrandtia sp.]
MNLLTVGASHRTAPVETLERLALGGRRSADLTRRLLSGRFVDEAVVLSTCNRVEVYAAVSAFHGGLAEIAAELAASAGIEVDDISGHLYVRHEAQAVRHAFSVASGLDSLVAGETQILGQLRDAYESARESEAVSRLLHDLMQQALRVGKRVHTEANVGQAAPNTVGAALDLGSSLMERDLEGLDALVVGAGAMGALTAATLRRRGVRRCFIANRDAERAHLVAATHDAEVVAFDDISSAAADVDVIVSATGSPAPVIDAKTLSGRRERLLVCDLAVPRDVAEDVAALAGVSVVDITRLARSGQANPGAHYLEVAERILAEETEAFLNVARSAQVTPTVAALRARADEVVDTELSRLRRRAPSLSEDERAEVAHTVHRVVRQLLHQPTVRIRQLAGEPGGESYAAALRELFALDPEDLSATEDGLAAEALRVAPPDPPGQGVDTLDLKVTFPVDLGTLAISGAEYQGTDEGQGLN